jgi:glyoxylase-like metal-dependent hydrolase (beta-lactamase superfamily II)
VADGDVFDVGDLAVQTLHTPGHTPGSVCYLTGLICFVGDTLFAGSLGRAGSRYAYHALLDSVRARLLGLPEMTALLPGHGPATTVGEELRHNPFF